MLWRFFVDLLILHALLNKPVPNFLLKDEDIYNVVGAQGLRSWATEGSNKSVVRVGLQRD